jgi:hypothetical protein
MHHPTIASALTAVLALMPAAQAAGLYTKNSPVLQVDGKSYERLIAKSNYTSVRPKALSLSLLLSPLLFTFTSCVVIISSVKSTD